MEILNKRLIELLSNDGLTFTLDNNVPMYLHHVISLPVDSKSKNSNTMTINKLGDRYVALLNEEKNKSGGFSSQPSKELSFLEDKVKILQEIKDYKVETEKQRYKDAEDSIKNREQEEVIKDIINKRKFSQLESLSDDELLALIKK